MTPFLFGVTRTVLLLLASAAMSLMVCAIAEAQNNPVPILDNTQSRTNVNKDFVLNITEREIIEQNYKASTSISVGEVGSRGLSLRIGAGVRASEVDIRLHNIQGKVHFHGSGERLVQSVRSRGAVNTTSP